MLDIFQKKFDSREARDILEIYCQKLLDKIITDKKIVGASTSEVRKQQVQESSSS